MRRRHCVRCFRRIPFRLVHLIAQPTPVCRDAAGCRLALPTDTRVPHHRWRLPATRTPALHPGRT